ncbi:helix-turn-helix domain-containing protein [Parafrankia sp. FMc6]
MCPALWPPDRRGPGRPRGGRRYRGRAVKVLQAYRFALDPNQAQLADLRRHAGAARFVFNWGLARVKAALSRG